jgi:hypothetical protein
MKNLQFEKDIEIIPSKFSKLKIVDENGEEFLKGELDIIDRSGALWESYQIEIKGSESYPNSFPKLFETGNSFPKILDWHVYQSNDKSCCVDVLPNEILLCRDGLKVEEYIYRFAIPYFANQTFRKREGYYLYGEYSHGIFGRIEYYQKKLRARTPLELIQMLDLIINDFKPDRTASCPFCPKTKFRKCHRKVFKELESIKDFIYFDASNQLIPFFKANPDYNLPRV